jgi:hypothetical protein
MSKPKYVVGDRAVECDDYRYRRGTITAAGEALAISIPRNEAGVIRHFQERMPPTDCLCRNVAQ